MQSSLSAGLDFCERSEPINNLRLKIPSDLQYCELWDHRTEDEFWLIPFREKPPNVILDGGIFATGLDEFNKVRQLKESPSVDFEIALTFEFNDTGECNLHLHKPLLQESIENWEKKTWNKFAIIIPFTGESAEGLNYSFGDCDFEIFTSQINSEDKFLSLKHVLTACGKCCVTNNYKFDFTFSLAIYSTSFVISTIPQLEIAPSALLEDLIDPKDNSFYRTPKSGFIGMDEELNIRLIIGSDPIITTDISIVGIWISGVNHISNFYVWTCCARYFHHFHLKNWMTRSKEPFMVIIFDNRTKCPSFYDCKREYCEGNVKKPEFNVYQLLYSATFEKTLLYQKFPLKFDEIMTRLTFEKCLRIPGLSLKSSQKTSSASTYGDLVPTFCDLSRLEENNSRIVSRIEFNKVLSEKDEIIRNLQSQLDIQKSRSSNSFENINKRKKSKSTMTNLSMLSPELSRIGNESVFSEVNSYFQDIDPALDMSNISDSMASVIDLNQEEIFREDESQAHYKSGSPRLTELPSENYAQPRHIGTTRKIMQPPRYPVEEYSEFDNNSRFDYENTVQESVYSSIPIPRSQYSTSKFRFECSQQFQEYANKYLANEQRSIREMPSMDFSYRPKEYRKNKNVELRKPNFGKM